MEKLYYLSDYSDEIMPCRPALEAWADWLSKPDPQWNRPAAAAHGDVFQASTGEILGDVRVERIDGEWTAVDSIPPGTHTFFLRPYQGAEIWDSDFAAETIADATDGLDEDPPVWFACVRWGPDVQVRYETAPDGPRCVEVPVQ